MPEIPAGQSRTVLSLEEYRDEVLALVSGPTPAETVSTADPRALLGRVLADDVTSRAPVPAFANSAMDGYAVRWADLSVGASLHIVAEIAAGDRQDPTLGRGECAQIMTGAPLPHDADTVVPVEATRRSGDVVTITQPPARGRGAHIRGAGEDLAAGDTVCPAGTTLDPAWLAAVAAAGCPEVSVRRRPVLGIAATGDELVAAGSELARGQIYESNGTHLAATAVRLGAEVAASTVIPDDEDRFVAALDELSAGCDLVVLSGGVSVGVHDVARIVLGEQADGTFRHVRIQPGKPQGWARWRGRTPVLALPGNPVSTAVSFELFGRPVLDRMLGRPAAPLGRAVAARGWSSPPGRRQLVPVRLSSDPDGGQLALPAHRHGSASHMVTSLAGADALAEVPEDTTDVVEGDVLTTRSLR